MEKENIVNASLLEAFEKITLSLEGENNQMKSPVSILQEFLCTIGYTPKYDFKQVEEPELEPMFHCQVTCGGEDETQIAVGVGTSKKKAKQMAANNLIFKLTSTNILPFESNGKN